MAEHISGNDFIKLVLFEDHRVNNSVVLGLVPLDALCVG